jgi:hypothetical protein
MNAALKAFCTSNLDNVPRFYGDQTNGGRFYGSQATAGNPGWTFYDNENAGGGGNNPGVTLYGGTAGSNLIQAQRYTDTSPHCTLFNLLNHAGNANIAFLGCDGVYNGAAYEPYGVTVSTNGYYRCPNATACLTFLNAAGGANLTPILIDGSNNVVFPAGGNAYITPTGQGIFPGTVLAGTTNPVTIGGASGSCAGLYAKADGTGCGNPGGGTTTNALTAAASGGAAPGSTFNGSASVTFDYHSFGAQAALTNPVTGTGTSGYLPKMTGASAIGNSACDDGVTTATTMTCAEAIAASSFTGTGTTPAAVGLVAGSGSIPTLAANSAGFAAPVAGGTAFRYKLPATATAGILHAAAPATNDGVNESALTSSAVALATDVSGQLPISEVGSSGLSGSGGVVIASTGAISLSAISLTALATQAADTFLMNLTAGAAAPTAVAFPITAHTIILAEGTTTAPSNVGADTTTTHALFATAGDPAFRAIQSGDIPVTAVPAVAVPTPGTSITLAAPSGFAICTGTCTVSVPVPAAGYQFCIMNDDNVSTAITLSALGSSARYESTARTSYGTAGTGTLTATAAAGNMVCIVGRDSTHYLSTNYVGTWTAN